MSETKADLPPGWSRVPSLPPPYDCVEYALSEEGILYSDQGVWMPVNDDFARVLKASAGLVLPSSSVVSPKAPYTCSCGGEWFRVFESGGHETSASCRDCRRTRVVHSG